MSTMQTTINSVNLVSDNKSKLEIINFIFSNGNQAMSFMKFSDACEYINKEVIVTLREEIINGNIVDCVTEIASVTKVAVLDREENFKLYCDTLPSCESSVCFDDCQEDGTTYNDVIVFVVKMHFDSSEKANWCKLTIMDKKRRTASLRIFDPEEKSYALVNTYIQLNIKKTKYGYITQECFSLNIKPAEANPEVKLAEKFILNTISFDTTLRELVEQTELIERMKTCDVDDGLEIGYEVVRCAVELALARDFANLSKNIDFKFLMRLVIYSRMYLLSNSQTMSKDLKRWFIIAQNPIPEKSKVMAVFDKEAECVLPESVLLKQISDMAKFTVGVPTNTSLIMHDNKIWRKSNK